MLGVLRRLDRYVLSELIGPLGLGLLVYTFILLMQTFFRLAEMIIKRGLPATTVGQLLLFNLPNIVVLTLPMSFLLAVLVGVGRLASDSELVALRASGVSLFRILRPVMLLAALLCAFNVYLMLELLPRGNTAYLRLFVDIATRTLGSQFEPRVFYNEFQGKILYVFDIAPGSDDWRGVFLADSVLSPDRPTDVLVAERGRLELSPDGEQVSIRLENAVQHTYDLNRPDRYETRRSERLRILLRDRFASEERSKMFERKSARSMNWSEASAAAVDPSTTPQARASAQVQRHKFFAIPAAGLVFGLLALPLAFNNRRGGKSSGFAFSIGIVVVYWVLLSQGEKAAIAGELSPATAMWLPNLLLGGVGLLLLVSRNRDRSLLPAAVRRWLAPRWLLAPARRLVAGALRLRPRRTAPAAATASRPPRSVGSLRGAGRARLVLRLPRLRVRFPNLIDRYVLRQFFFVFLLVILSGVSLLIVTDFTENVDEMMKHRPPASVISRYYKYQSLQLAYDIAPIAVLVTTLVTFSLLSRSNEVTACRALGISLYRMALPALAGALAVAALFAALQAQVLPASNLKVAEARAVIKGQPTHRFARSADRQWQMGRAQFMYNFLHFDERHSQLQRLQVFEFDSTGGLVARLYAEEGRHDADGWVLERGWTRTFTGREQLSFRPFAGPVEVDLEEPPSFFAEEPRRPEQMTYGELADFTSELRESGRPQPKYEVALHNKLAFPIGSIVMALVGFPFAFRLERRGALYGLGVSIALGLVFILVFAFFTTLGEVAALPPAVAVWSPSLLFSLLAAYLFTGVRS
jgi:LPS export ABC transporter permease LptG/LPS export ABC transporter permease LptF